jgi:hypothetical protein
MGPVTSFYLVGMKSIPFTHPRAKSLLFTLSQLEQQMQLEASISRLEQAEPDSEHLPGRFVAVSVFPG